LPTYLGPRDRGSCDSKLVVANDGLGSTLALRPVAIVIVTAAAELFTSPTRYASSAPWCRRGTRPGTPRAAFEGLYADTNLSEKERATLDRLRIKLGVRPGDAHPLEMQIREEMAPRDVVVATQ
jgi:hypothetical protein